MAGGAAAAAEAAAEAECEAAAEAECDALLWDELAFMMPLKAAYLRRERTATIRRNTKNGKIMHVTHGDVKEVICMTCGDVTQGFPVIPTRWFVTHRHETE